MVFLEPWELGSRKIERDYEALSKPERERDLGSGMTMGELASDRCYEFEVLLKMNGYFGILTAYSVFERCLLYLFTAVRLKLEQNQLVGVFGEIGVRVDGLKGA